MCCAFHVKRPDLVERYVELLLASPHGLLSTGDRARAADHVADALAAAPHLATLAHDTMIDVGSGGGLPGIPLAIALEPATTWLVDSRRDKAAFLTRTVEALGIADRVTVCAERAEALVSVVGRESLDLAVARALAAPVVALEYLAPFTRVGGHVCIWATAGSVDGNGPALAQAAAELGCGVPTTIALPSALRSDGVLLVFERVESVPSRYPRRPGVARKRPLG